MRCLVNIAGKRARVVLRTGWIDVTYITAVEGDFADAHVSSLASPLLGSRSKAPHLDGRVCVATAAPLVAPAETRSPGRARKMHRGQSC